MTAPNSDGPASGFNAPLSLSGTGELKPIGETFAFLEPSSEPGDLGRIAQYRVLRLLGAGGMGFVFEAEDTHLARRVALKVMRPEFAADLGFRERFLIEARAAAGISSDHIVTVYQVGMAGDVPFQAIQLLAGESLQDRLERGSPLPVGLACLILRQIADGLSTAHAKGLIHRDIKPANIWLESKAEGVAWKAEPTDARLSATAALPPPPVFARVKILDFGLARSEGRNTKLTATGMIVGTPHYMAPEQAAGLAVDGRADLFSLGCVAYSMFTGELAFEGTSAMAVLMALANHTPPALAEQNPAVPRDLSDLVAALLAKDPAQRPATAAAVGAALDAILARLPESGGNPEATGEYSPPPARSTSVTSSAPTPAPGKPAPDSIPSAPGGRRWWPFALGGAVAAAVAVGLVLALGGGDREGDDPSPEGGGPPPAAGEPIPVGVLHSQSRTMAVSEKPVVDATRLAIDEVNAAGGVLGRKLVPVELDGASDPDTFAKAAEQLFAEKKAAVIFGCWTSASRKAVRRVVERNNGLLFYPVQYEGLEQSPRIVYLGPAANQQLIPALDFLAQREGKKRLFLVGSDYVFPHAAHEIVKDEVKARKGAGVQVVGETFLPLGTRQVTAAVEAIKKAEPDAILNTINGTTNFHFLRELNADPATADIPVLSVSLMESDLRTLDPKGLAGDFLAGNYFEGVGGAAGKAFLEKFRRRYGPERRYSDPLGAAYCGVHLWAKAAAAANSLEPEAVVHALRGMTFAGPAGEVTIDPETLHTWLPARIGRIRPDGGVEVVEESPRPLQPVPFPGTRTRAEWDRFLNALYVGWDGKWQAPEPASNKK